MLIFGRFVNQLFSIKSLQQNSDLSLIILWQQGDEIAFEILYKRYVIQLMALITGKTGSKEVARELTQEVFLAVYQRKMDLQLIGHFNAWLFAIAKNKIFNYYRHELVKREYQNLILLDEGGTMTDEGNRILENKEQLQIIQKQIENLPPRCREVFKLSRQENLTYKGIAQRLNISEHTVDQHIRKALGILRSTLERQHQYYNSELVTLPGKRPQTIEKLQQKRQDAG